jgi:hypothetical protein
MRMVRESWRAFLARADRFEVPAVAALVVAYVGLLWWLRGEPGMTWDEPYFFERSRAVADWLGRAFDPRGGWARAFGRAELEKGWPFCRAVPDQHPPVPSLLGLATEWIFGVWLGPLRGYRLATVGVFAVAAGVMFRLVRRRWGLVAGAVAVAALVSDPRPFVHAQLITADSDLGAFWFFAAVAHLRACETGRGARWFGVWAGLAIMCKATGVLVLPAAFAWAFLYRPRGAWRPLIWASLTMPLTMVIVNPAWWTDPAGGMVRWVRAFLAYPQKVPVYYLGTVYDSVRTFLPWHNTIVLTATMVPIGLLVLTAVGLVATSWRSIRDRRAPATDAGERLPDRVVGGWAAIHFLTYLILRMTPYLPAHDGLRQIVPAYYFLPVLAALGAVLLMRGGRRRAWTWVGRGVVFSCAATAAWEAVRVHPFEMAYYNAAIGGPRGAKAAGMETTYFWDSATDEVIDWMNAHLPRDATVLIFPPPNVLTFGWEQKWGRLRPDLKMLNLDGPDFSRRLALMVGERPCYLIFQNRQGLYMPRTRDASDFFARLAEAPALYELAPARVDGVRLLAIFDRPTFLAAGREAAR